MTQKQLAHEIAALAEPPAGVTPTEWERWITATAGAVTAFHRLGDPATRELGAAFRRAAVRATEARRAAEPPTDILPSWEEAMEERAIAQKRVSLSRSGLTPDQVDAEMARQRRMGLLA